MTKEPVDEGAGRAAHPTHDPDLLLARAVPGAGTWCSRCDGLIADGSIGTDIGVQPCRAYPSRLIVDTS